MLRSLLVGAVEVVHCLSSGVLFFHFLPQQELAALGYGLMFAESIILLWERVYKKET